VGLDLLRLGGERLRVGPWRGDDRVAYIAPLPAGGPSVDAVRAACVELASRGYSEVVTAALSPSEAHGFIAAGFTVRERLHLLAHDLVSIPAAPPVATRRGRRVDRPTVLDVDRAAFDSFWRLDETGLEEAMTATPSCRFRVAGATEPVAYAVSGRAGRRGFVQRLAVNPSEQRRGLGSALVIDGLRWMKRRGVDRAVVNTQERNETALALYRHLGFTLQPNGLAVLRAPLS
jgi:GNAT superfamily N-acetyltransferase